jgi:hypothetical protein
MHQVSSMLWAIVLGTLLLRLILAVLFYFDLQVALQKQKGKKYVA